MALPLVCRKAQTMHIEENTKGYVSGVTSLCCLSFRPPASAFQQCFIPQSVMSTKHEAPRWVETKLPFVQTEVDVEPNRGVQKRVFTRALKEVPGLVIGPYR